MVTTQFPSWGDKFQAFWAPGTSTEQLFIDDLIQEGVTPKTIYDFLRDSSTFAIVSGDTLDERPVPAGERFYIAKELGRVYFDTGTEWLPVDGVVGNILDYGAHPDNVDNVAAIQAAIDAVQDAGGGKVIFPNIGSGVYNLVDSFTDPNALNQSWHLAIYADNIELCGEPGAWIYSEEPDTSVLFSCGSSKVDGPENWLNNWLTGQIVYPLDGAYTIGVTSITLDDPLYAENFAVDDYILIQTGQVINIATGIVRQPDSEINRIRSIDDITGVVELYWPTTKPYAQEYYLVGDFGLTSTTPTVNPAPYGIANINGRVLENITINGLNIRSATGKYVMVGGAIVNYNIKNCNIDADYGFQSQGTIRFGRYRDNRCHINSEGSWLYHFSPDTGTTDIEIVNNLLTARRIGFIHLHEGTANILVDGNSIASKSSAVVNEHVISVSSRCYNITITNNRITGNGGSSAIQISEGCDGGGIIMGNHAPAIAISGDNWYLGPNVVEGEASIYTPLSTATTEVISGVVRHDAQSVTIGEIPAYSHILGIRLHVTEAFNSGAGSDEIQIGTAADPDAFGTLTDVSTIGIKIVALGVLGGYQVSANTVLLTYVNGGSEPSQGKASVVLEYVRANRVL